MFVYIILFKEKKNPKVFITNVNKFTYRENRSHPSPSKETTTTTRFLMYQDFVEPWTFLALKAIVE